MLSLFLEFLKYISDNLTGELSNSPDDATYRDVFNAYLLIARIIHYLEEFSRVLGLWQNDALHGSAWAGATRLLGNLERTFALLGEDLYEMIWLHRPHQDQSLLRCKLRGGPSMTNSDVLDIWKRILHRNANDHFCDWVSDHSGQQVKRTLYIPNYSLLLPLVQRTSQIADLKTSQNRGPVDLDLLDVIGPRELNYRALTFLPELPPEFPIDGPKPHFFTRSTYAKVIETPAKAGEMTKIIRQIQQNVTAFRPAVDHLCNALIDHARQQPDKLLRALQPTTSNRQPTTNANT